MYNQIFPIYSLLNGSRYCNMKTNFAFIVQVVNPNSYFYFLRTRTWRSGLPLSSNFKQRLKGSIFWLGWPFYISRTTYGYYQLESVQKLECQAQREESVFSGLPYLNFDLRCETEILRLK